MCVNLYILLNKKKTHRDRRIRQNGNRESKVHKAEKSAFVSFPVLALSKSCVLEAVK